MLARVLRFFLIFSFIFKIVILAISFIFTLLPLHFGAPLTFSLLPFYSIFTYSFVSHVQLIIVWEILAFP